MELELLFLLLPIAALSGWWIGRRDDRACGNPRTSGPHREYFRGLNYLINEQPDKAIEVFVRMVEADSETIETHFALGSLFRRRGEVDRAIRIHQNLIARPTLNNRHRNEAIFELARDYHAAGLLDRAEGLYEQLTSDKHLGAVALRQLTDIYQQERDWARAIEVASRLRGHKEFEVESFLCHYHCELAEAAIAQGRKKEAMEYLRGAPHEGRRSVRASLLEGQIALARGNGERALQALRRIEGLDPEFLPEALEPIRQAYLVSGRGSEWLPYLDWLASTYPFTAIILARCVETERQEGAGSAAKQLGEFLRTHPSVAGMERLIGLQQAIDQSEETSVLSQVAQQLVQSKARYRCTHCGFYSRTLYWHCPGCSRWGTVRPIYGIEGE